MLSNPTHALCIEKNVAAANRRFNVAVFRRRYSQIFASQKEAYAVTEEIK